MHNGLSICQTKYCETTFLHCHAKSVLNNQSTSCGLSNIIVSKVTKKHYVIIASKLSKTYQNLML